MDESQKDLLDVLEPLNVEARYPTHKDQLFRSLTEERCKAILESTEELFAWDNTEAIESVKKYADRVRRDFNVKKVILFGSYVKGTAREDSDIDVAVVFEHIDGDYLDVITRLSRIEEMSNTASSRSHWMNRMIRAAS